MTPKKEMSKQDMITEHGEDGRGEMSLPQSPQEVEELLGSLGYGVGVEGPGEVICDVDIEELGAPDDFHSRASDVQWGVVTSHSSEVNNHLLSLVYIQRQVVGSTPVR
ncbi:hypothetical protein MHYP_G00281230 [Metynnis hypsauchen]